MNTETTIKHNSVFDNKEQYLAFRAKWKALIAEGFHRPVKREYMAYWSQGKVVGHKMESPLTAYHHAIYAAALGRDLDRVFSKRRPANSKWHKPLLYWTLIMDGYKKPFTILLDVLTEEQQKEVKERIEKFMQTL